MGVCVCVCVCVYYSLSCNKLFDCGHQAPLSVGFSRQECWSGLPCPPPASHGETEAICLMSHPWGGRPQKGSAQHITSRKLFTHVPYHRRHESLDHWLGALTGFSTTKLPRLHQASPPGARGGGHCTHVRAGRGSTHIPEAATSP